MRMRVKVRMAVRMRVKMRVRVRVRDKITYVIIDTIIIRRFTLHAFNTIFKPFASLI